MIVVLQSAVMSATVQMHATPLHLGRIGIFSSRYMLLDG